MEITKINEKGVIVLELHGRLDADSSLLLEERLFDLINTGEKQIVADMKNIEHISSASMRVFLIALKELKKINGNIILASMQSYIKEVFELAGFSTLFSICSSREKAIQELL